MVRTHQSAQIKASANSSKMDFKISPIISVLVFILLFVFFVSSYQPVNDANSTSFEPQAKLKNLKHIRDYLKKVNKPAVKTIKSPDGDLIDCVPSHQQPAFDHPLLKGQMPRNPPEMPKLVTSLLNDTFEESFQVWTKSNETCPENTVPIRRTTQEDVFRASSIHTFGRKPMSVSTYNRHEHAIVHTDTNSGAYYGAAAVIDVWAPYIENPDAEFSIAQIWLLAGSSNNGNPMTTIEAGWQVHPSLYHGPKGASRLFVYWTADGYDETGCYDLLCAGFVQVNHNIIPGGAINPVSSNVPHKRQGLSFKVFKDVVKGGSGNWWLYVRGVAIGYWPKEILFGRLRRHDPFQTVQLGGEVVNTMSRGVHTTTKMGSGHFPSEGYDKAACVHVLEIYDKDKNLYFPANPKTFKWRTYIEKGVARCYSVSGVKFDKQLGSYFFCYGGPGGAAPNC